MATLIQSRPKLVYRFGSFELDSETGQLRKFGYRVPLQEQPFRILSLLLQHPTELITREHIRDTLWSSETFVDFDRSLNKAMVKLRQALNDDADAPRYIETLPRRGYRFLLPVELVTDVANGVANSNGRTLEPPARNADVSAIEGEFGRLRETARVVLSRGEERFSQMRTWIGRGIATVACFGIVFWLLPARAREVFTPRIFQPRIRSLAVLPLENLSGDPAQDYFADGMTEELTTELSQVAALKVISRTSAMRYKKTDKLLPQIARELNVDAIVEGTVLRSGDRVRVTAQLIRANSDDHIWASSYEQSVDDVLSLQETIAREITKEIRVSVTPQENLRLTRPRPVNLAATDAYLQGEYHFQKAKNIGYHRRTNKEHETELKEAVAFYQNSIAADSHYAPAYIRLAEIWGVASTFPYPTQSTEASAREAVRKAITIDPELAEAHLTLAKIELRYWYWPAAEREVKRAIELNPNLASAHSFYSDYLSCQGRLDDSMEQAEWAKSLDPNDDRVAWVYYVRHDFGKFIELKKNDVARQAFGPLAHFDLGYGYERAGRYKDAVDEWATAMHGWGYDEEAEALRQGFANEGFQSAVRAWAARVENRRDGEIILPDLPAYLYAISGDKDRAFAWLEKDIESHSNNPQGLNIDPTWDDLRSDPRYSVLLRRVGLIH